MKKLFRICLALAFLWVCGFIYFLCSSLVMQPENSSIVTGAIVVLTGDGGRVEEGLKVFGYGRTQYLFISGAGRNYSERQVRNMWTDPNPLKDCCIVVGHNAGNTVENAREIAQWLKQKQLPSIRLVTSNYHMRRAELEISHLLPDLKIIRHAIRQPEDALFNLRFFKLNLTEYNKCVLRLIAMVTGQDKFK